MESVLCSVERIPQPWWMSCHLRLLPNPRLLDTQQFPLQLVCFTQSQGQRSCRYANVGVDTEPAALSYGTEEQEILLSDRPQQRHLELRNALNEKTLCGNIYEGRAARLKRAKLRFLGFWWWVKKLTSSPGTTLLFCQWPVLMCDPGGAGWRALMWMRKWNVKITRSNMIKTKVHRWQKMDVTVRMHPTGIIKITTSRERQIGALKHQSEENSWD